MKHWKMRVVVLVAVLILPVGFGVCDTPKKPQSTTTSKDGKATTASKDGGTAGKAPAKTDTKTDSKNPGKTVNPK